MIQTKSSAALEGKGPFPFLPPDTYLALALALANHSVSCWFNTAEHRPDRRRKKSHKQKKNPKNILCWASKMNWLTVGKADEHHSH